MSRFRKISYRGNRGFLTNGHGERIWNPKSYFEAVAEDRYGFNQANGEMNEEMDEETENYAPPESDQEDFGPGFFAEFYGTSIEEIARERGISESDVTTEDIRESTGND